MEWSIQFLLPKLATTFYCHTSGNINLEFPCAVTVFTTGPVNHIQQYTHPANPTTCCSLHCQLTQVFPTGTISTSAVDVKEKSARYRTVKSFFITQKLFILLTQSTYVFHRAVRLNSNYSPKYW